MTPRTQRLRRRLGFTLVELLVALILLGLLVGMLATSFYSVTQAWTSGRSAIDSIGHSDYLMEQLTAALRSAYYPGEGEKYGFILVDDGDENDTFEWTKVGPALVGEDAAFADVPHRIRVSVTEPEGDFPGGFTVRAWRQDLQLDDFDPEIDTVELTLSPRVVGINCRLLDPDQERDVNDELNWIDEWAKTNTLPSAIELTLYMKPNEDGEDPIESKRIIEVPMAALSQNPSLGSSATKDSRSVTNTSGGGGGGAPAGGGGAPGGGPM